MMCKKCDEIDERITGYRRIAGRILDDSALLIIALMITQCETKKHELHAEDSTRSLSYLAWRGLFAGKSAEA
jgi:hypothetical protein